MSVSVDSAARQNMGAALARGGAFMVARHVASLGVKLVSVLLIARLLGPATYGVFAAAAGLASFALACGQAGVGVYLIRRAEAIDPRCDAVANTLLAISSIAIFLAIATGADAIEKLVGISGLAGILRLLGLAIPFQIMIPPALARLERSLDYRSVAFVELTGQIIYCAIAALLAVAGYGAAALPIAFIAQHVAAFALAHGFIRDCPRFAWDWTIARDILRYASSFAVSNAIWQARRLVNPLIVGSLLGAHAVGVIAMTISLIDMLAGFAALGWRMTLAAIARVRDDPRRLRNVIATAMELQTLFTGAALLGFGWFGGWIIPATIGAQWLPTLTIYPFLALGALASATFSAHSAAMTALDRNGAMAAFHIAIVAIFAIAAATSVSVYGLRGYGYAELAALPAYILLHVLAARLIGTPDYRSAAIWWTGAAIGLFWRELGAWAIAAPFLALLTPASRKRIASLAESVTTRRQTGGGEYPPRRFLILTCRDPAIDFRLPLALELQRLGHETLYVWLRRRPIVMDLAQPDFSREMSFAAFVRFIWSSKRRSGGLVTLNSTNLAFPVSTLLLQVVIGGVWCFDLHDDLLYDRRGLRRVKADWLQRALVRRSDFTIHAAPLLAELFPRSRHLGNASSMTRAAQSSTDFTDILILASLDERLDFDFLQNAARLNTHLRFTIHGHVATSAAALQLRALAIACPNIRYAGGYDSASLPAIISAYAITFAPYVARSRSTRYIDPLRYYHCLNAGLEVVTTDIPRARQMADQVHIAASPEQFGPLIARLSTDGASRKNMSPIRDDDAWRGKASRFVALAREFDR